VRILIWAGVLGLVVLVTATAVGFLGETFWIFDLAAALRVHYALGFLVLAVLFASTRHRWLLAVSVLGLVTNLALIVPLYVAGPARWPRMLRSSGSCSSTPRSEGQMSTS
jgi:hypothetical protein